MEIRFGARNDVEKFFKYLEGANKEALKLAKKVFPQKFPIE